MVENVEQTNTAPADDLLKKKPKSDPYIIGLFFFLLIVSVVESFSASSREISDAGSIYMPFIKHCVFLGGATIAMFAVQRIHYSKLVLPSLIFGVITFFIMIYILFFGGTVNGAQRALRLGPITIQSVEMAKLSVVFLLAYFLSRNIHNNTISNKGLIWCVSIVTIFGVILILQGMTNTILFMCISFSMLIIGRISFKNLMKIIGIYAIVIALLLFIKGKIDEYQLEKLDEDHIETVAGKAEESKLRDATWGKRLEKFFSNHTDSVPLYEKEITPDNQQEMYAYMAQANGRVFGVLPGNSRESSRLPLAFSDYVYSIIVEDWGFFGGTLLCLAFFILLIRAGNIARKCKRAYPAFLVMGAAVMIVLQAYFHIAINVGFFPVSGQTLPLISKGGSAILICGATFGVILSVSRSVNMENEKNKDKTVVPESISAANPTKE